MVPTQTPNTKAKKREERISSFCPSSMALAADTTPLKSTQQQFQQLVTAFTALNGSPIRPVQSIFKTPVMQRGRMYEAYSELRESKLRRKRCETDAIKTTPNKKASFLAVGRSVPNLSVALRKENKKPNSSTTPPMPPGSSSKTSCRVGVAKSATGGDKRVGGSGIMRKSCVNLKELKSMSAAAAFAIDEEGRRGGRSSGMKNRVLGSAAFVN